MITPQFISVDSEAIVAEMVADYETRTGRILQPGQAEMLLINAFAYREKILRQQIQATGLQMLLSFATAPALDYLVELIGVTRLSASAASCLLEFSLTPGHNGVVIPANTRVASTNGQIYFFIKEAVTVPIGTNTVIVSGFAGTEGAAGNDYAIGTITNILDPWANVLSASNTTATSGGGDQESDEELRERARLAPSEFSVAGPVDAYKSFARKASPDIIDVYVPKVPVVPGTVKVYPLVSGGVVTPQPVLDLVLEILNDEKVRPLSDTVEVLSPTVEAYNIEVDIVLYTGTDTVTAQSTIEAALLQYVQDKMSLLGADIKLDHITALCVYDNTKVFDVAITSPVTDITIDPTAVAVGGTITVNITGTSNG